MRKLLLILALCLLPGLAFAQAAAPAAPSITITPPKVEMKGVTPKQVLIVAAAVIAGAVLGEFVIGELVGDVIGSLAGAVAGYFIGSWAVEEDDGTI
ncbi:MAG: hypothetical protein IT561_18130 [Alphaproteobacteria bacterium]|nr:hypothetical protein [Alphaproteobacteria bacterium]